MIDPPTLGPGADLARQAAASRSSAVGGAELATTGPAEAGRAQQVAASMRLAADLAALFEDDATDAGLPPHPPGPHGLA